MAPRLSGLQKQVLSLYRECLRTARRLPIDPAGKGSAVCYIVSEFRHKAGTVDKLDFQRIEHLLRQGKKRITSLASAEGGVTSFGTSDGGGGREAPRNVLAMIGRGAGSSKASSSR